ncbi:mediator of RNA polymerase II transcription subunit 12-like protein, partial [Trifolium pratense]
MCDALAETGIADGPLLNEALQIYLTERCLILRSSPISSKSSKDGASIEEVKETISLLFGEFEGSVRRPTWPNYGKIDPVEGTPGCEECRRAKKQKLSEERSSFVPGDDDTWWVKKGSKPSEPLKVDQPQKTTKQVTKSRQKNVRKMSLAQLAASRIEGSQGPSTSHVCDNKVSCPHHRTAIDGDALRYENILVAADLIPEALSLAMHRTATIIASNARVSNLGATAFTR